MFVVIEGCDGAGKTSQSKALAAARGAEWMCFPDRRTYFGKLVDGWLKEHWGACADLSDTELIAAGLPLMGEIDAAVFQALQTVNRLELADKIAAASGSPNRLLICDRYWMSGYAYGSADGLDPELLLHIHKLLPEPDACILLDVESAATAERMTRRENQAKRDLYERRGPGYFQKVAAAYDKLWGLRLRADDPRWFRLAVLAGDSFDTTHGRLVALFDSIRHG